MVCQNAQSDSYLLSTLAARGYKLTASKAQSSRDFDGRSETTKFKNKPEYVQTSKPRANAMILITIKLKKERRTNNPTIFAVSAVSQQWLSIAQNAKMFTTIQ